MAVKLDIERSYEAYKQACQVLSQTDPHHTLINSQILELIHQRAELNHLVLNLINIHPLDKLMLVAHPQQMEFIGGFYYPIGRDRFYAGFRALNPEGQLAPEGEANFTAVNGEVVRINLPKGFPLIVSRRRYQDLPEGPEFFYQDPDRKIHNPSVCLEPQSLLIG